jgi:hypothetical protein
MFRHLEIDLFFPPIRTQFIVRLSEGTQYLAAKVRIVFEQIGQEYRIDRSPKLVWNRGVMLVLSAFLVRSGHIRTNLTFIQTAMGYVICKPEQRDTETPWSQSARSSPFLAKQA